jgi:hypothetical protein
MWPSTAVRRPCEARMHPASTKMQRQAADWARQKGRSVRAPAGGPSNAAVCVAGLHLCAAGPTPGGRRRLLGEETGREKPARPAAALIIAPGVDDREISVDDPRRSGEDLERALAGAGRVRARRRMAATATGLTRGRLNAEAANGPGPKRRFPAACAENGPAGIPRAARMMAAAAIVGEICVQTPSRSTTSIPGLCRVPCHLRSWPLDGSGEPPKPTHVQFRPSNEG